MYTGFLHYKGQSCAKYAENNFFKFHIQYLKYLGNGCPLCPGGSARTAGGARQVAPAGRLCAPRSRSPLQFIQPPPPVHPSIFKTSHSRLLSRLKTLLVGKLVQSTTYHTPPAPPSHNILPTKYLWQSPKWTVFSSPYNFFHIQVSSFAVSHLSQFVNQFADASPEVAN